MKTRKTVIYAFLAIFILYTLYKIVMIYVLNVSSLKSSYIYHSNSIETSKSKGLYIATYQLDKTVSSYRLADTLMPTEIFIEKEKVIYPQYYFYWGKSETGDRYTVNGTIFSQLSKASKYDISSPLSTLPNEKQNMDRGNLFFFFATVPSEIIFIIYSRDPKPQTDTLIFKKQLR